MFIVNRKIKPRVIYVQRNLIKGLTEWKCIFQSCENFVFVCIGASRAKFRSFLMCEYNSPEKHMKMISQSGHVSIDQEMFWNSPSENTSDNSIISNDDIGFAH